jgi:uncharacterized peroxidase-related enzyme
LFKNKKLIMNQFDPVDPQTASAEAKIALDRVQASFGGTPNLMKMLARSPDLLNGVVALNQAVTSGDLAPALVEQIALLASGINQCEYCVAVHIHIGQQMGLSRSELLANLQGEASDPTSQAVLNFTKTVVRDRGQVDPLMVQDLRDRGFTDKAILEIVGVIGLYTLLNYVKHLTQPVLDFPMVAEFKPQIG